MVHTVTLHEIDVINSRTQGFLALFSGTSRGDKFFFFHLKFGISLYSYFSVFAVKTIQNLACYKFITFTYQFKKYFLVDGHCVPKQLIFSPPTVSQKYILRFIYSSNS